ncbi:MAG: glycosyltransferase family 4 protein [Candidatus Krumholzibacteriota bacterium]|nr:glycosyltransferase family 4 protein [Candidatus Krumholzibacteriota bacterium]
MRIGLELSSVCQVRPTGCARYSTSLVTALAALRERSEAPHDLVLLYRLSRWRKRRWCHRPPNLPVRWYQEPLWPPRPPVDLVHGTDVRVPAWRGVARVATIHDVFSLIGEDWFTPAYRERKIAQYRRAARLCHRLVAVSETTRRDFLARVDCPPERLRVVSEGVDPAFAPAGAEAVAALARRRGLPGRYLLYLGSIDRRKNVGRLIGAYARSRVRGELPLVLAGGPGFDGGRIRAEAEALGLAGDLVWLGYAADAELPALYSGAAAFLFPTLYEGFGLPILEAMACGTPVLAGDRGAAPETAGGHAVLADPEDETALAAGIEAVLGLGAAAREAARAHASRFTWEACARGVLAVYEEALGAAGA